EAEHRGESDGSKGSKPILAKPRIGISYAADYTRRQVLLTAEGIAQLARDRIVGHCIDGEVAARKVVFDAPMKGNARWPAPIEVGPFGAKRGDLDRPARGQHSHRPVLLAGGDHPAKEALDVVRQSAGGDVVVAGLDPADHVAHAS